MRGKTELISFKDKIFQIPKNEIVPVFYNWPAYVYDGTINGTIAVDTTGGEIVGVLINNRMGQYQFSNVPAGYYTVVVRGEGIEGFVPTGYDKYEVLFSSQVTGSDLPYKDGSLESIATKIDYILSIIEP